jgi:spore germination protein YaaH
LKWQDKNLADSLKNQNSRQKIENEILDHLQKNGLSGVSIDFESIPVTSQ